MKKLVYFVLIILAVSCKKDSLISDTKDSRKAGEEKSDSTYLNPTFDVNDWEGSIDVGFGFGAT